VAKAKKQAKAVVRPPVGAGGRTPKTVVEAATGWLDRRPVFSFQYADNRYSGGDWSCPEGDEAAEMLNFLCEMGA
jgi:hypothetical protein